MNPLAPSFEVVATCPDTGARAGVIHTPHGDVETPIFMPVGTRGSVKGLTQRQLEELGAQIILGNTYHLYLRPGPELVRDFGGLHGFMSWDHPILTDSGGFQVWSLAKSRKITEEGVMFSSVVDGSKHFFSPERSIEIQHQLGADIIMAFDECAPSEYTWYQARASMDRTHRWLDRCITRHQELEREEGRGRRQMLFSIIQGGIFKDLKRQSAEYCNRNDIDGIGIGGDLRIEKDPDFMYDLIADMRAYFPEDKPRYLMGAGRPDNIVESLALGVDMWDCVLPTRIGRHGVAFTHTGKLRMEALCERESQERLDALCSCEVCRTYSRGYIRHLLATNELLGGQLLSYHNLYFLLDTVKRARRHIIAGTFPAFLGEFREMFRYR